MPGSACSDLDAEYRELAALVESLDAAAWARCTAFHGWSAWDEIAHLLYFDEAALQAIEAPEDFASESAALSARMDAGEAISAIARARFGHLDGPALLSLWRAVSARLVARLGTLDAKARLPWYGPTMSARSFASARLMETWAHGQDVWDALGRRRPATARLRHIAHLGVSTYGWSFTNRGLDLPVPVPYVELDAPGGETWRWGEPSQSSYVRGGAQDFCLVVTQRRNVADTALVAQGEAARRWLAIAQCFAGPSADPPPAGTRGPAAAPPPSQ